MTLNGVIALVLRYFTEFVYDVVGKKLTFVISSPGEFRAITSEMLLVMIMKMMKDSK